MFSTPALLITSQMKKDCSQLSICDTNSGQNPLELDGTNDPNGILVLLSNKNIVVKDCILKNSSKLRSLLPYTY
jgi:hypothetical protein